LSCWHCSPFRCSDRLVFAPKNDEKSQRTAVFRKICTKDGRTNNFCENLPVCFIYCQIAPVFPLFSVFPEKIFCRMFPLNP
ncbi:MAG TPA: hypothetical protein DCG49_03285, partial [Ruminococcus sp.]|nr:hypothetical protein [Ruminococcus sp.]